MRLIFQEDGIEMLGEIAGGLGGRKALVVSDPGVVRAGHAHRAMKILEKSSIASSLFDGVIENPTDRCIENGVQAARAAGSDLMVGLGGGSSVDSAKGIGLLLSNGGKISDYRGVGKVGYPLPPTILIPTTAGTGSEVQSAAIISETLTGKKMVLWDKKLVPDVAILDPRLTLTQPRQVTAATAMDAIGHAVESHVCTRASSLSRMFSREAFRLLLPAFEKVNATPADPGARADLLLGASLAGLAIEHSMLGAAHSSANPLTAHYGITHGLAIGIMLPHVIRYNGAAAEVESRYAELVRLNGGSHPEGKEPPGVSAGEPGPEAANRMARRIWELLIAGGMPTRLRDLGVEMRRIEELSREAESQWTAGFNPRPVKASDFVEIYKWAY